MDPKALSVIEEDARVKFTEGDIKIMQKQSDIFNELTTRQKEVLRAINHQDFQYLLDLGTIDKEIDLNFAISNDGMTPLMLACGFGNKMIV